MVNQIHGYIQTVHTLDTYFETAVNSLAHLKLMKTDLF